MPFVSLFPAPRLIAALCLSLLGAAPCPAPGSILLLSNGDRLTGQVIREAGGNVYFHSDALGDLVAPLNAVTIVESPSPAMPVEGLTGAAPQQPDAGVSRTAPRNPGEPVVLVPSAAPWTGKVEFGYDNAISNDVRTVNLTLRAETERTIGPDNLLLKGRFLYGANNGLATTDKEDADGRWRHSLSKRVFLQTDTSYNSDKIQLVNYELQQNAGLGCTLYKDLRQTADVGAGATAQYLDATGIDQGFDYLGNFFQDYSFKINRWYKLMEDMTAQYSPETRGRYGFVPDLSVPLSGEARDYAYRFHTTLQGKISARLSLNLHYEYEFDNAILNPSDRTEQRITTTLGYGF